jgi:RimJ/RimL family protein N-acetyltransferase
MSSSDQRWHLRPACAEDSRQLWAWANDPLVRCMAFSTAPIPWDEHERWFATRLASSTDRNFLLTDADGTAAGQIRFEEMDERPGVYQIDISIAPLRRGHGLGRVILRLGEDAMQRAHRGVVMRALVKRENAASLALFRSAGYVESVTTSGPNGESVVAFEKT